MCNCIDRVQEALDKGNTNTMLNIPTRFNLKTGEMANDRVLIGTVQRNSRKSGQPMDITPTYCPFCGEKYPD
jgi:hypothetical protein